MKISAFIVAVLLVLLGGLTAASLYFYNFAIKRGQKEFLRDNRDLQATFSQRNESRGPTPAQWVQSRPWEIWQIRSRDELKLVAHYLPAPYPTGKTAILAHGYTGKGKDMGRFARFYHEELGFNVLMPDARGHGESEGITSASAGMSAWTICSGLGKCWPRWARRLKSFYTACPWEQPPCSWSAARNCQGRLRPSWPTVGTRLFTISSPIS